MTWLKDLLIDIINKFRIKQCCSCEHVFRFAKGSFNLDCPSCNSYNWIYGYIDENDEGWFW